ncbi:exonuclease domain-containing protein [Limnohabitans sp. Bal53]|uniref:3'-5' exonuclease n=1 Tax=Limnohabitans sp. Bal53 TaxID=1977910 RepID=UPI000D3DA9E9|nr:exonuclease domain-containing protein [Limnohabitans sp. Bal53]PUE39003.1 DNA polymerase III subunit epsilon [Limnohabitans sp. Bal53]
MNWKLQSALTVVVALVLAVLGVGLVWAVLTPEQAAQLGSLLAGVWPVALLALLPVVGLSVWFWRGHDRQYAQGPDRLLERVQLLKAAARSQRIDVRAESPALQRLGEAINALAAERDRWRDDVQTQVEQASQSIQQERNRLAALMSELNQSVVVCNLDGRIVLFNNRARLAFKLMSGASSVAGGAEWVGIGRSIYAVLDRPLVAHALENLRQRMARGASQPSTQFLTSTTSGQLLRVHMAPVRSGEAVETRAEPGGVDIHGFVLTLDNVTHSFEEASQREQRLLSLAEATRASLAKVQSSVELLILDNLPPEGRQKSLHAVRDEVGAMGQRITDLVARSTETLKTRWPLEDMLGADLVLAAQQRIAAHCGRDMADVVLDTVNSQVWLKVDSFGVLQVLTYLASRLFDEFELRFVQLRLAQAADKVHLDLVWTGQAMSTETVMTWELDPMHLGQDRSPLTVRDVMDRHGGVMWFERERTRHQAFFRLVLPRAGAQEGIEAAHVLSQDSRPEYYDFDLFQMSESHHSLDDRPLKSLSYTVFDTETTGLNPSQGDEILQIGAARIVNGRLLRQDAFEQLIDPGRSIPAASIPIHGISPAMVQGQPRIGQVLPTFHAYAHDTVLVAHNAAFDMKFLQLKEASTGLRFDQPVLDTLLLSAVVHPNQESHRLEAIAERMNITVLGRHTALGDAMVTAEVFLRMIPLLAEMGIHTLGQAREAAQKTYYARLKY